MRTAGLLASKSRVHGGGKMNAHQKLSEDEKEEASRQYPLCDFM